ncbi:Glycosyltransferase involved in cell wall bisynthesis [Humidesulfovibrio mexicanus]|uniref:Glycosyltransferase involved in cell wall bisynthesis n=1 Tax=Humidesulfovibrio mexicanus TaxID=147047 RepID=A0A239CEM5_9BACT|nr:glycosyltransferase family 2 protein [Humidesulfovibrio mexicanus]SNS18685.1 Glycosyltransferase involved in cell wall bisynthesis [Humidesulfovibrio mexicanus]
MEKTLSIVIPAYNEEANIRATVEDILWAIGDRFHDFELIIVDDGSADATGRIIDELAASNRHIRAEHNPHNMGFGASYKRGVSLARMNYVGIIPGDNEIVGHSIAAILDLVGSADIIVPFTMNMEVRPYSRRLFSRLYTLIMNMLFTCELQYYNGPVIHRRDVLMSTPINTSGFAFQSTLLVRLVRSGRSFIEVPMYLRPRLGGRSTALKPKNVVSVCLAIARLVKTIHFDEKRRYAQPVNRILFPGMPASVLVQGVKPQGPDR